MNTVTRLTVRYAETDKMGIVHHSNYPIWFEAGRTDFIKQAGISYSDLEARGVLLPLYEVTCRFKIPAKYEDEIAVITRLKEISCVRMALAYEVINVHTNALLATGETLHAFTGSSLKPINAQRVIPEVYALLAACQGGI